MATAKVTLVLEYNKEDTEYGCGIEFESNEDFLEYVKDCAHEDIWDLIRGADVESWAEIELVED